MQTEIAGPSILAVELRLGSEDEHEVPSAAPPGTRKCARDHEVEAIGQASSERRDVRHELQLVVEPQALQNPPERPRRDRLLDALSGRLAGGGSPARKRGPDGLEQAPDRRRIAARLGDVEEPTASEHAAELAQAGFELLEMVKEALNGHAVELAVLEAQRLGVSRLEH